MSKWALLLVWLMLLVPCAALAQVYQVDEVVIEGNRRVESKAIQVVLKVQGGEGVSAEAIDRDIRAIFELGRFQDVQADLEDRAGKKVLVYRVAERPLVRKVEFSGNNEFDEAKLKTLISIRTPEIYHPRAVEKSIQAIKEAYIEEGYYAAEITHRVDVNDRNEANISFAIDEGDKILIRNIRFSGNTIFSDRKLRKVMETKERWFLSWLTGRGAYREQALQTDLEIIADQYYNVGYVQVKVKEPRVIMDPDKKFLDLLIEIEEGEQFRVGTLDVRGDLIKEKGEILALIKLREGEVFSRKGLRENVFVINDLYADQGYAYVNVSPLTDLDLERRRINLMFDIEQGVQVSIGRIRISGNTRTRDKVIRREMKLVEGDLYSSTKMKASRARINNLGFFEEVNVTTAKGADEEHMDVDVAVKERATGTFSVGFGYSSVDHFIGQGSVSQENFLGRALKLNLSGSFGGSSTTYQLGITDPYFLDKKLTLGFDVYKTKREWSDFTRKATGGDLKLGFPLSDTMRSLFVYRYEEKEILDVATGSIYEDQAGTSTISSLTATLTRNTTDYHLDPTRGAVSELSVEYAGLGGTEKFSKYVADYRHFFPLMWGTVISAHGQLGYVQGLQGEEIPVDERFFLGGINTLRGFKSREVGPRVQRTSTFADPVTGALTSVSDFEYIGGDKKAIFNLEYTFPLLKDMGLKGILFFDAGNAWSEDQDLFEGMRTSVGGGIRWFSPMGPLRLEWGYNLDPMEGEDRSQFEFSIGRFF